MIALGAIRRRAWLLFPLLTAAGPSGCFRQTVHSGLTPSETVVQREMVATWLWGIIPATPIDVRPVCQVGVAKVETQQTFINGLAAVVTLGLYSPQWVRVTCAEG